MEMGFSFEKQMFVLSQFVVQKMPSISKYGL